MKNSEVIKQGYYKKKPITAYSVGDVIQRFYFNDKPGEWFFPLIEDGVNVERERFKLEGEEI